MAQPALTITDAFNDYDAFADLLQRIGVTAACRTRLMDEEGIDSAAELAAITMKDLQSTVDNVNKLFGNTTSGGRIYFAPNRISRIKAVGLFFKRCLTINTIPDIRLITLNKSLDCVLKLPAWTEKADDTDDIVKQKDITFEATKFKTFRDELKTLLSSTRGTRGISLEYVIRHGDDTQLPPVELAEPDVDSSDIMASKATLYGPEFDRDNAKVFTVLRTILTGTPGWNIISKYSGRRDGRKAFLALSSHYQGRSYHDYMRTQANALLTKTFYNGDKAKFKWENYVAIHLEAHALYEETGETLSHSMKIMNLKSNIRDGAGLENTIEAARTSATANATFDNYVNFLTEGVTSKRGRAETFKMNQPRSVASAERSYKKTNGQKKYNNSAKSKAGSRVSHGYIDKGQPFQCDGKTLYPNKRYSSSEYASLTPNQKNALKKAHKNAKRNASDAQSVVSELTSNSISQSAYDAVIAGVKRAAGETDSHSTPTIESGSATSQLKKRRGSN